MHLPQRSTRSWRHVWRRHASIWATTRTTSSASRWCRSRSCCRFATASSSWAPRAPANPSAGARSQRPARSRGLRARPRCAFGPPGSLRPPHPVSPTPLHHRTLTLTLTSTQVVDINPKSVKTEELYGYISMATREWKDGLLSKVRLPACLPACLPPCLAASLPRCLPASLPPCLSRLLACLSVSPACLPV